MSREIPTTPQALSLMYVEGATVIMPDPAGRPHTAEQAQNPHVYGVGSGVRHVYVYENGTYDPNSAVDARTPHVMAEDVVSDVETHRLMLRPATTEAGMLAMEGTVDNREELITGLVPPPVSQVPLSQAEAA